MYRYRLRLAYILSAAVAVVVLLGAMTRGLGGGSRTARASAETLVGPLRGPEIVELGVVKPGQTTAQATFENAGPAPVRLFGIQTSCGCIEAGFVIPGEASVGPECVIGPGESAVLRLSLRIPPKGPRFRTSLSVRTDHPDVPTWRLNVAALVRMGLTTDPNEVALGRMGPGEVRDVELVVRDDSDPPAGVPVVVSSDPAHIEVIGVTASPEGSRRGDPDRVAAVQLRVRAPAKPGELVGWVTIADPRRPGYSREVRVTGVARSEYESSPDRLRVSRRRAGEGCAFYIRNTAGRPFQLEPGSNAPWSVTVETGREPRKSHLVRVSIGPAAWAFFGGWMPTVLEFRARCGGSEPAPVKVPITLLD